MISCIIVDDEQHAIDLLTAHVKKIESLDLKFTATNPIKAFEYLQKNKIDLVYLDIHMPELDGIQFLKLLKGRSKAILTTAYSDHALESYDHDIVDYLLKPIVFERFLKASQKAIDLLSKHNSSLPQNTDESHEFMFVKTGVRGKMTRIVLNEIEYIEASGNYLSLHTDSAKVVILSTMKEIEQRLPLHQFIRIHNSYIVPVNRIIEVEGNQVLIGKHKLPVGDVYKSSFLTIISKYMMTIK